MLYSLWRESLLERKNGRIYFSMSNRKPASYLEDLRKFSVKDLQGILKHYHENISEKMQTFWWEPFTIFGRCQPKLQSQQLPSDSFMDHTTSCTYTLIKLFINAIWKNDILKIPNFKFFQQYHYFVVITEKYNGDLSQRTSYKRLKSIQFFMRVISKQWSYVPLNYLCSF